LADQIGKDPTFQLLESAEFRTPAWHSVLNRRLLLALDLVLLVIAGTIVRHSVVSPSIRWYTINTDGSSLFTDTRIDPFYIVALLLLIYCQFTELYSKRRPGWDEYRLFSGGWLAGLSLDLLVLELSGVPGGLAGCLATWGFLAFAVPLGRCCLKLRLARFGLWNIPTVVIGCGDNALQAALALEAEPMLGLRIKAFIAPDPPDPSVLRLAGRDVPVLRLGKPALDSLRRNEGPHIVLALDNNESLVAQEVLNAVAFRVNAIDVVLPMHGIPLYGLEANHLLARELLVLSVRNSLARFMPRLTKRLFDLIGASVLLVALSPVFLVIGLALARRSGGPIVFGQQRLGQRGNPFRCLKFRIMRPDAAELLRDLLLSKPK